MPIHASQSNFLGGEVSPHLYARTDAPTYSSWVKTACNFFVHPQGGISNRPGTAYMNTAKYADKRCRLLPFVIREEEAYILEVGHQYIRVHAQAGTLLRSGAIYEIAVPYTELDIEKINYVQSGSILYLVHPDYAPYKLIRQADGYFSFEALSLQNGPFMVANTDNTKKMRLYLSEGTVTSEGVKATLSFLPADYPNYFIRAYWRGEHFYDPNGYGFDVADVVNYFNARYSSTGCIAYNQGGVLRIESPQATGGDYNGATLTIYYYSGIASGPKLIVNQSMSGGQNAGEIVSPEASTLYLEADFDAFRPGHAGALWTLTHRVESSYETGTLGYSGISTVIKSGGDWSFRTTGSWYGEIVLESSQDQITWEKVKHFTKSSSEDNLSRVGTLADSANMRYLRLRCLGISGEMGYVLQSEAFEQEGIVQLESYVNARQMVVSIKRPLGDPESWTVDWAEGSFSADAGFPGCVFFYQDRLGFAGTQREAQTIWFSKTGEYEDFGHERTLVDSDAISITLASKKLNAINSVAVSSKLLVFTSGSEWSLSSNGALSPFNIEVTQEGERGASRVNPIVAGNRTLYVQARGGIVRDFYYEYASDSYTGNDLTLRAKHLFFNREIKEMVYQQEPDNLIWCILDNGELLSLTYLAQEAVWAWTRHQTQGTFLSACSIPARGYDETWFLVQRNGGRYIERLLPRLTSKEPEDQIFLDASVSKKSLISFTEISGLEHLEGENVSVLADGKPISGLVVEDGTLTLPQAVHAAHVGLSYESVLQTLPIEYTAADGTMLDRKRRLVQLTLKVLDSFGGKVAAGEGKYDDLAYTSSSISGTAPRLQTADIRKILSSSHGYFPSVSFLQTEPLPITILTLISQLA